MLSRVYHLLGRKRPDEAPLTHEEILAYQHAELLTRAAEISAVELPDQLARQALSIAITRNLIIGVYQAGYDNRWVLELNHFGAHPICPRGHEPRLSCEQWGERYAGILEWPYPQDDGSDDEPEPAA
jgi:hypothetical protein